MSTVRGELVIATGDVWLLVQIPAKTGIIMLKTRRYFDKHSDQFSLLLSICFADARTC